MKTDKRIANIKRDIKKKFGSQARFARIIEQDVYFLQLLFANCLRKMTAERERLLTRVEEKITETNKKATDTSEITEDDREKLKAFLSAGYSIDVSMNERIRLFIEEYELKVTPVTIYQILDGRRKRRTELFKRIIKIIGHGNEN